MQDDLRRMTWPDDDASSDLNLAIGIHDANIADSGMEIWIGAEPTFTLRSSEAPEWLSQALGGDKYRHALNLARELYQRHPGSLVLRSAGRQYGGEDKPRWSIGLLERRDAVPVWSGPPDPAVITPTAESGTNPEKFISACELAFEQRQWSCRRLRTEVEGYNRLLVRMDATTLDGIEETDPRLLRPSVHIEKTPRSGLVDTLASDGYYLFIFGENESEAGLVSISVELPAFAEVTTFLDCTSALSVAAVNAGLPCLLIQGYPPPVDASVSWTTITPDPAVIEINQAPYPDAAGFFAANLELFQLAENLGLSPYRLQYNGTLSDSGGGGQFTVGGATPAASPFFAEPRLLSRLARYFALHPALSYVFAPDYVGGASQLPRADEGTRDAFQELGLALAQLERQAEPTPEFIWASLAPFLADSSGNSHRSELNIEKLWNSGLPLRGCLGLLEFRAFRMPQTPQRAVAIAMLLRGILAMLAKADLAPGLYNWGGELHDRFALPFFLRQDLLAVLQDMEQSGFGLDPSVRNELLEQPYRSHWSADFAGLRIALDQAIEFWPLVGDVASQERGGSRLVDSSTLRLQISLSRPDPNTGSALDDWHLQLGGYEIPLRDAADETGTVRLIGLRYRDFMPWRGLHPSVKPWGPLAFILWHPAHAEALQLEMHTWRADGRAYDGLPSDLQEAAKRRAERLVLRSVRREDLPQAMSLPPEAVTPFAVDLRWL